MQFDICLIHTPIEELLTNNVEPPLGLLYLATFLSSNGKNCVVVDYNNSTECGIPFADFYGFSTYTPTYYKTKKLMMMAKQVNPEAKVIAGGPHASALPVDVLSDGFDYVVVGEGEKALLDIINHERSSGIIYGNPVRNLDELPFPDYSFVDVNGYTRVVGGKKGFCLVSSRGCPHRCLFCNSVVMGAHKPIRFRSPQNVIDEMKSIMRKYGDVGFRFQDDIFAFNIDWLKEFTHLVKPLNIIYRAFVRAIQCANEGFCELLYEGGCRHVSLGIESGSDYILAKMQKGETVQNCKDGIIKAKAVGLIVRIYLIVGFPGESWETIHETVDFVREVMPHEFAVYPLIPYPGTPIFAEPVKYGLLNIDYDFRKYWQVHGDKISEFSYDLSYVSRDELQCMKEYVVRELEGMSSWYHETKRGF